MSNRRTALPLILALLCAFALPAAAQKKTTKPSEKDPQYQYEKGVVALNYGFPDEAIRYGNLAVALDPKHYGAHNLLGHAYHKKGDLAQARVEYETAAALRPDLAEAHFNLGLVWFDMGDMNKAEPELRKAASIKEDAFTSYYLARTYYSQTKFEQALDEVQKSISKNAKSPAAYNLKGVILNQLNRYSEAAGSFQAGLVLAPDDFNIQLNLGIAYMNSNEPAKAKPILEKILPKIDNQALKARIEDYLKSIKAPDG